MKGGGPVDWRGKRAIVLGAETVAGRAVAESLAGAGARLALVATSTDAQAAFAVQRLARRLSRPGQEPVLAQAIDATNDMAIRVMVRQMAKSLGGLHVLFFCADLGAATAAALELACRHGSRELGRTGGGAIVCVGLDLELAPLVDLCRANGTRLLAVSGTSEVGELARAALELAETGEAGQVVRLGAD